MSGSWSQNNAPVGARLFSGGWQRPGTAPSAAALGEMQRIRELYGLAQMQPAPTAAVAVPRASVAELYGLVPPEIDSLPELPFIPPEPQTRLAPASVPADVDPSSAPRTPPQAPNESARRLPVGTGRALAWRDLLGGMLDGLPSPPSMEDAWRTSMQAHAGPSDAEPGPYMAPENYPRSPAPDSPASAPAAPQDAVNATAGVTRGRPYARLALQDPDYERVLREYDLSAPQPQEEPPNARVMRLVASALAGGFGGSPNDPLAPLGSIAGLAGGYAREEDRDLARRERDEALRREFQRGRAGVIGGQEDSRWNTGLQRQTFDRQSQSLEEESANRREGLAIQRDNAGLSRTLTQMRIAALARQAGQDVGPAQVLAQGLEHVVSNPGTQLLITDDQGRVRPLTFRVGNDELTIAQLSDRLMQRRGSAQSARDNPLFATNPNMAIQQTQRDISDLMLGRILTLPPSQQQQVLRQLMTMLESRRRAGTTRLADE